MSKKTNPSTGILFFLISILIIVATGLFGFVYGIFYAFFTEGFKGIGKYTLKIAISIDQLGNVQMQHLLNLLWVKKGGYKFGNRDETISSALGRNKKLGTLTSFGNLIDKILECIDERHSLNSIDYYIEPTEEILDKIAWIYIVDKRILSTRSKGKTKYCIPGGKREIGKPDTETLSREITRKLSVVLNVASLQYIGHFEAKVDSHEPSVFVRVTAYHGPYKGEFLPNSEIEEMVWLPYRDRHMVSKVDKLIFDFLKEKEWL